MEDDIIFAMNLISEYGAVACSFALHVWNAPSGLLSSLPCSSTRPSNEIKCWWVSKRTYMIHPVDDEYSLK